VAAVAGVDVAFVPPQSASDSPFAPRLADVLEDREEWVPVRVDQPKYAEVIRRDDPGMTYYVLIKSKRPTTGLLGFTHGSEGYVVEVVAAGMNFSESELADVLGCVGRAFDPATTSPWVKEEARSERFAVMRNDTRSRFREACVFPEAELRAARVLADSSHRSIARTVRKTGASPKEALAEAASASSDSLRLLQATDLLSRAYAVICNKTNKQINRFPSQEALQTTVQAGARCACGTALRDEIVQEVYESTELLRRLMDGSLWMAILLANQLMELGVASDRILLGLQSGPDELDIVADIDGAAVVFELKDDEFSMGHLYPLLGRVARFKPDKAVVVATKGIASDVGGYLSETNPSPKIDLVPSLEDLPQALTDLVSAVRSRRLRVVERSIQRIAGIDVPISPPRRTSARTDSVEKQ
jgi:hypothetical protein